MSLSRDPEEAVSHGAYRAMVEQRNEARAERDRYGDALRTIGTACASYTGDTTCVSAGRTRGARYMAEAWCDQCIAREALDG